MKQPDEMAQSEVNFWGQVGVALCYSSHRLERIARSERLYEI